MKWVSNKLKGTGLNVLSLAQALMVTRWAESWFKNICAHYTVVAGIQSFNKLRLYITTLYY
jgi:hypothetical protein